MSWRFGHLSHNSAAVGIMITLLAVFVGMVLLIAPRYIQHLQERGPYSSAPECPPGQQNTTVATECRLVTQATVVKRWYIKSNRGDVKLLQVETADHNSFEFSLPYDNIVSRVAPGNTIRIELWRGHVRRAQ